MCACASAYERLRHIETADFSAQRDRLAGEITPISAAQSNTLNNNEKLWGAQQAIDQNPRTKSMPAVNSKNEAWLEVSLDKVYCVETVIRYNQLSKPVATWTCTELGCDSCDGDFCGKGFDFTLTVYTTGSKLLKDAPLTGCKYGDRVKLMKLKESFNVHELVIVGKQGEGVRLTHKLLVNYIKLNL